MVMTVFQKQKPKHLRRDRSLLFIRIQLQRVSQKCRRVKISWRQLRKAISFICVVAIA